MVKNKFKVPLIILYTDDQAKDFKRSCCAGPLAKSAVIGCDKTFNFGPVHLKITCFKQPIVNRTSTCESPIFFGPMLLHGNSDTDTYLLFFQQLSALSRGTESQPVLGTDDEGALTNDIDHCLSDMLRVTACIFGDDGMATALDDVSFSIRERRAHDLIELTTPTFLDCFDRQVIPLLKLNMDTNWARGSKNAHANN